MHRRKRIRLERLAEVAPNVPRTFWSVEAFVDHPSIHSASWVVRGEGVVTSNSGLSADEVVLLCRSLPRSIVIQEFIPSATAGVSYIRGGRVLSEAVEGSCRPLLRDGKRGDRWAGSSSGEIDWLSSSILEEQAIKTLASRHARALEYISCAYDGIMLEWVLTPDDSFYWVDLKELGNSYISEFSPDPPSAYYIGSVRQGDYSPEWIRVPDTNIAYVAQIERHNCAGISCAGGCPLAHLCVHAFEMRIPMIVYEGSPR